MEGDEEEMSASDRLGVWGGLWKSFNRALYKEGSLRTAGSKKGKGRRKRRRQEPCLLPLLYRCTEEMCQDG